MPVNVKICGLKTEATLLAALDAGADYIGLNFYPNTPRRVDIATAASLAAIMRGRARVVALVVDADEALIRDIASAVAPDLFQLHGMETPERVAGITAMTGIPAMKAISVRTAEDASRALAYLGAAELILFDAKPPEGLRGAMPGGNGVAFDWRALLGVKDKVRYMLSGGLTPENVAEAIRLTGATAVDVSSGVESAPGDKDPDKIRRFIAAAKSAG
jgi:phosphoribosylanthranilate isomerase